MASTQIVTDRRPAGRLLVLLVLAVLTGVLGMHALPPSGAPAAHADAGHTMVMAHAPEHHVSEPCSHTAGGSDHLDHADGTCAAAGVGSPYAPPALAAALMDVPAGDGLMGTAPVSAASGRAPPDLSELQLLRI
ncbi:DUF6153 family protein [Streptomyces sp. V1I6]|uniref:DUF6153 family protein n=1 Tax=Streptomyces sp. V1I6 TaxID=3042273 RepID=UPI0027D78287|nr:DUF6153 family protein [Streptomyces sp. V1I6]